MKLRVVLFIEGRRPKTALPFPFLSATARRSQSEIKYLENKHHSLAPLSWRSL